MRFLLVLLTIPILSALGHAEPAPSPEKLVPRLGHRRYSVRDEATKKLMEVGEPALPALRAMLKKTDDLEVRRRARLVLAKILDDLTVTSSAGLELVLVKAGRFRMGSENTESGRRPDESLHPVRITRSFFLGKYEVTQSQYEKLMGTNPAEHVAPTLPVERVTWLDALELCNRLSKREGYEPYYLLEEVKTDGEAITHAKVTVRGGNGFRLPTEAEWEYACRAGTSTPYHYGRNSRGNLVNLKAHYLAGGYGTNSAAWKDLKKPIEVGRYPGNAWGLHNMHGNVAEWVWDWYDKDFYRRSPENDPTGPASGRHRVVRGGSWMVTQNNARSATRFYQTPDERKSYIGFRVARTP